VKTKNTPVFHETQKFTQIWVWMLLLIPAAVLLYKTAAQIVFGVPWGNEPPSNALLLFINAIWLTIVILFATVRLDTRIDKRGISYRFKPFHQSDRVIRRESISGYSVEEFSYMTMRGFHGIRFRPFHGGWTYTIRGNKWIKIDLQNGKRIFIGTQKPAEASIAIRKMMGMV